MTEERDPAIETKPMACPDVMSIVTGVLVDKFHGVHGALTWMAGEPIWTHQIPRVMREAVPVLLAMHPDLQAAVDEAGQVTPENVAEWRDRWIDRYGPEILVPRMTVDQHERIDPHSELAEKVHPNRIIPL